LTDGRLKGRRLMIGTSKINSHIGLILVVVIGILVAPSNVGTTDITLNLEPDTVWDDLVLVAGDSLSVFESPLKLDTKEKIMVVVTAYSSSIWETWGCPYTTASNSRVRDGVVANNMLPFGTKIRFPELFGEKVFVVEDRMHYRKGDYHFDIWFPSRSEALQFGVKQTIVEIVQ
ncbi:MAG TPA: 3D domain-containing protein, partial [Candidatus Pacearchaeota archaeon]|nr:3D domain-containing protein [Candidatus Pacearchaeota archaeon]HQQ38501.1 3D domain-containing protein [bacterium]